MTVLSAPACNTVTAATITLVSPSTTWTTGIAVTATGAQTPFVSATVSNGFDIRIDVSFDGGTTLHDTLEPLQVGWYPFALLGLKCTGSISFRQNSATDPTSGVVTVSALR